jgi:3-methyladenine DNA glycosylase AlkC
MPSDLKSFFDQAVVEDLTRDIKAVYPNFQRRPFIAACMKGLDRLELLARGWHIAEAMKRYLPADFETSADILVRSLGPELNTAYLNGMAPLRYLPHVFFVAKYGLDHFEASMQAQYELTKRFTAEYSIRAFLQKYPEECCQRLREWAADANVHVRRLVSEGTRPRLPWAPRLRAFQHDPAPVLSLLELLEDDSELYVRRSVANNLNDIGKDHPEVLLDVCRKWSTGADSQRRWIIRHALRSLVKKGDPRALALLGFAAAPQIRIEKPGFSARRIRLGEDLTFSFDLVSAASTPQVLLVDFAVHFVKANGTASPKVFKLARVDLPPTGRKRVKGSVSFKTRTTRKQYPGVHKLDLRINGAVFQLGQVRVAD